MHEIAYHSEGIAPGKFTAAFVPREGEILFLGEEGYDEESVSYRLDESGSWQASLRLGPEPVC